MIAALNRANVRSVVVGGLASGAHGLSVRLETWTLFRRTQLGISRRSRVLTTLEARHPIQDRLTAPNIGMPSSIKVETRHGEVRVLNRMPGTPSFEELEADAMLVEVDAGESAPDLLASTPAPDEHASDRPRDRVDLEELDELYGPE